jgi:glycosyltransferase involved in cell wall biosynthesis
MRVLLDISPVTRDRTLHTGLARVACCLASALAARQDLEVECVGWGSVAATFEVRRFLADQSLLAAAPVRSGRLEVAYDRLYRRGTHPPRLLVRVGQVLNKVRNPLRGLDPSRYDVVHSTYAGFPRVLESWAARKVITIHDITAFRIPAAWVPPGQAAITRRIMASVRPHYWAVCVSEFTRRDFLSYRGHPAERSAVIPNGVDDGIFRPCKDAALIARTRARYAVPAGKYLLTLSSLAPHKNLRFLLKAWASIPDRAPDWTLVVVGGKTRDPSALASGLGLERTLLRQVHFTGFVPDEDLPPLLTAAQVFAFPSLYEGFGLPVLEAMACGCPVVASSRASLPEVVGAAGRLVDPDDLAAWSSALGEFARAAVRTAADDQSRVRAAAYSWSGVAAAYRTLYAGASEVSV